MVRFRADDETAPLEIELLEHGSSDASDVSFGARTPRARTGGRRAAAMGAGVVVLAVIVGTTLLVRNDDDSDDGAATPTSQAGSPSTTDVVVPVPTIFDRTTTTTTAVAMAFAYEAPAVFDTDPGWRVYLGTPSFLQAFDPATGGLLDVEAPDDLYLVIAGAAGPTFLARDQAGNDGPVPVGDGTGWRLSDGSLVRVNLIDESPVERVALAPSTGSQQFGPVLIGTDATDRPVLVLPDFRAYSVALDGSMTPFADGAITTSVSHGRYVTTDCSDAGRCATTVYSGEFAVSVDLDVQQLAFSRNGTHVVLFGTGPSGEVYRVVDLRDGATQFEWGDVDASFTFYGFNTSLPGWSPDGRFFFVTVDGALQVFDTTTNSVLRLLSDLPRGTVVRGVV